MRLVGEGLRVERSGRTLLSGVDVEACAGRLTVLVGPNGAGKTTLLKVLSGDLPPDAGRVDLGGRSVHDTKAAELARLRAVLPQRSELAFGLTVREVVGLGRLPWPESARSREEQVQLALQTVDLQPLADRPFTTLSGGERQRVQIARVLAQVGSATEGAVFLDEPTNHLDLAHQLQVLAIGRLLAERGLTVVAVLHDLALAARVADQVVLLRDGRVVVQGPPEHVLDAQRIEAVFGVRVSLVEHQGRRVPLPLL